MSYALNLVIADHGISSLDGLYSLNDLHKASGELEKHKPSNFLRLDSTKAIINELENERFSDMSIAQKTSIIKIIKGGLANKQGTWVCKELVYIYATWVSAAFHLMVIRAFDSLVNGTIPNTPPSAPTKAYTDKDISHLQHVYTVPEISKLLGLSFKDTLQRLAKAGNQSDVFSQPSQPQPQPQPCKHKYTAELAQFWQVVQQLDRTKIDHACSPHLFAINLTEIYAMLGDVLPPRHIIKRALKHSQHPPFIEKNKAVNSAITGKTMRCWVFHG